MNSGIEIQNMLILLIMSLFYSLFTFSVVVKNILLVALIMNMFLD